MSEKQIALNKLHTLYQTMKQLDLHEIHRLMVVLKDELEDPARLAEVKNQFKEGDRLEWFNQQTNQVGFCKVLQKQRKYVTILNEADNRAYKAAYPALNLSQSAVNLTPEKNQQLTKQQCSVGDQIGFTHQGVSYYGCIEKLNPKTASIQTTCNNKWRVGYEYLVKVIDSDLAGDGLFIEGECV